MIPHSGATAGSQTGIARREDGEKNENGPTGLRRTAETQMKIHSRIVVASDGYHYFSSMDESGEAEDGSKLPMWGGHLWRRGLTGAW